MTETTKPEWPARPALFLDLDGTLLELAEEPGAVELSERLRKLLPLLKAATGGAVAFVSGRPIREIDSLLAPHRFALAGVHGNERRSNGAMGSPPGDAPRMDTRSGGTPSVDPPRMDTRSGGTPSVDPPRMDTRSGGTPSVDPPRMDTRSAGTPPTATPQMTTPANDPGILDGIRREMHAFRAANPGVIVEDKQIGVALHYRKRGDLESAVLELAARLEASLPPGYELLRGSMVVEIKPSAMNKGAAVRAFMREPPFAERTPVFVGDDVTDEAAFEAVNSLGGVAVKVRSGSSAAPWRLPNVDAVLAWLEALVDREGHGTHG